MMKNLTRNNHYVPQWYQKGFTNESNKIHYLDLLPEQKKLPDGRIVNFNERKLLPPSKCFSQFDLYTTFFGPFISDIIEKDLFGKIDDEGARAVRAFIDGSDRERHDRFNDFFNYIDAQKTRTPKGLNWLKERYGKLNQVNLMTEMQIVQKMHCTMWLEGTREIVLAKNANVKFILSDHPVTIYNYACTPESPYCEYPNDPSIALKASQTIFPLDKNHCLILTNYEYAKGPNEVSPIEKRTNARHFSETLVLTSAFIRGRSLTDRQVQEINFVIKKRARRFIAAAQIDWLYPEKDNTITWANIKETLLPPSDEIHQFGGEMFAGFKDGSTYFQDSFGRKSAEQDFLKKNPPIKEPGPNDRCPCGQGRKYKKCCKNKSTFQRPPWDVLSIRERNLFFYYGIIDILELSKGKSWEDVRRGLNDEQVKEIYDLFSHLWPPHTDIISLLPKPDQITRAIYTGVVDPRVITTYATGATLYFDEILIQNPFLNPDGLNPEYSPLKHPWKFRQQTLKNISLFLSIIHFIDAGTINLIPDITAFNKYLRFQLHNIAEKRSDQKTEIIQEEQCYLEELRKDDFKYVLLGLPEDQQRMQLKDIFPHATEQEISQRCEFLKKERNDDPFALLQDDLYVNGGQITMLNFSPSFQITLFLAQITGAIIYTDSSSRWDELVKAQHKEGLVTSSLWRELIDSLGGLEFPFDVDMDTIFSIRQEGKMGKMRKVWQNIFEAVFSKNLIDVKSVGNRLKNEIAIACEEAHKEIAMMQSKSSSKDSNSYPFNAHFNCIIPFGGIEHNSVLRFLVTCGIEEYSKSVPMAIFVSRTVRSR